MRKFSELSSSGILWLINRVVFHPRGFALALHFEDDGTAVGWSILRAPKAGEVFVFTERQDDAGFRKSEVTLANVPTVPHTLPIDAGGIVSPVL